MSATTSARRHWSTAATLGPALTPTTIRFQAQVAMRPAQQRVGRDRAIRVLNIAVALLALIVVAPLMAVIALFVKATSRGPVIYRQPRVGLDRRASRGPAALNHRRKADQGGTIFTIYKFRTMYQDHGRARQVWASKDDPRITPVGRVLRSFRFDEIPQLVNVVLGDMNIVGPRPEQPAIFEGLRQELHTYRNRQRVLPGITGLAQITLPYDSNVNDVKHKVNLDLEYIRRRSVGQNLLIMAKTMPVMVFRKGAM